MYTFLSRGLTKSESFFHETLREVKHVRRNRANRLDGIDLKSVVFLIIRR
jgi:hypothetical protein